MNLSDGALVISTNKMMPVLLKLSEQPFSRGIYHMGGGGGSLGTHYVVTCHLHPPPSLNVPRRQLHFNVPRQEFYKFSNSSH